MDNSFKIVGKGGDVDAVVHGRYHSEAAYVGNCRWFILNPDLERRLKEGIPLTKYELIEVMLCYIQKHKNLGIDYKTNVFRYS